MRLIPQRTKMWKRAAKHSGPSATWGLLLRERKRRERKRKAKRDAGLTRSIPKRDT